MTKIIDIPKEVPVEYPVKTMSRKRAVLGVIIAVLVSQGLVPGHLLAPPSPASHMAGAHGDAPPTTAPGQSPCCEQASGALSFHEGVCCGTSPALPNAQPDLSSYTPSLSLTFDERRTGSPLFLAHPWHPPTL
jgi:hypothetical protein